jgi:hypothetical protein
MLRSTMRHAPFSLTAMIALALAAPACPVAAASPASASLEVPATVTAGQTVVLRWSALPAEVEELEIVLSLDGGGSYHVRVSPELEAREREYHWRVPDLPTRHARLMLRVGGEEGERIGALSTEFSIVHAEGAPRPELGFHEGEFWTGIEPLRGPAGADIASDAPRFEGLADEVPGAPPEPLLRTVPPDVVRLPAVRTLLAVARQGRPSGSTPREVPLRI